MRVAVRWEISANEATAEPTSSPRRSGCLRDGDLTRARKAVERGAVTAERKSFPPHRQEKAGPSTIGNDEIPLKKSIRQNSGIAAGVRAKGTLYAAAYSAKNRRWPPRR